MRNELLELKQREQELFTKAHELSDDFEELYAATRKVMSEREALFVEIESVQREMNRQMDIGAEEILDDIRSGKLGLINPKTMEPVTVTLFERR